MTAVAASPGRERRRAGGLVRGNWALWALAVVSGATALYLAALATQFGSVLGSVHSDADLVGPLIVGEHFQLGSGWVALGGGTKPLYSTLLFEALTQGLPLHELLWEIAAPLETLVAVGLVADATRRVTGALRAFIVACAMLCMSPYALELSLGLGTHTPAWLCMAAVVWALVWTRERPALRGWWLLPALALALFTGVNAASDELVYLVTLVPLLVTLAFELKGDGDRPRARRRMALGAGFALITVLTALATPAAGRAANVVALPGVSIDLSPHHLVANFELMVRSLQFVGNGVYFGAPPALWSTALHVAAVVLVVVTVAVAAATAVAVARPRPGEARPARTFLVFWAVTALALVGGYLAGNTQQDLSSGRYLVGLLWAVFCLAAFDSMRWRRAAPAALAVAVVSLLAGTVALAEYSVTRGAVFGPAPSYSAPATKIAAIAHRERATRGYAPYWDAAPITWLSHEAVRVFPVWVCAQGVCAFPVNSLGDWYVPHGGRTFVVVDDRQPFLPVIPARFGRPSARFTINRHITLYVFGYDVARRIGDAR